MPTCQQWSARYPLEQRDQTDVGRTVLCQNEEFATHILAVDKICCEALQMLLLASLANPQIMTKTPNNRYKFVCGTRNALCTLLNGLD